jgi:hypothetical protein
MALKKAVTKPNGLLLEYHRIGMVKIDTNEQITILLHSYLNEEGRNYEKAYARGEIEGEPVFPFVDSQYISFEYDEQMNIKNAYDWLKQQPDFKDAEDV